MSVLHTPLDPDAERAARIERVEREDLIAFVNASLCATHQAEFYFDSDSQLEAIHFLHAYILQNYRPLYARTLAIGANAFNQQLIIANLLSAGAPHDPQEAQLEGALIKRALCTLPPPQAYGTLMILCQRGCSNRRARAAARALIAASRDLSLHVLKYRKQLRAITRHFHLKLDHESQRVLFSAPRTWTAFTTPLYETFRTAHYSAAAIYKLPYTVAEGFAAQRGIPRAQFLKNIQTQLTQRERERLQQSAHQHRVQLAPAALQRMELTRLASFTLGLPLEERAQRHDELHAALQRAAQRIAQQAGALNLGQVALVLDRSISSAGSRQRSNRSLSVALASRYLVEALSTSSSVRWTAPGAPPCGRDLMITPRGQTNLVDTLLDALEEAPDTVIICSDGFENDPVGGVREVMRLWRSHVAPHATTRVLHINPVFDPIGFMPRQLSPHIPTLSVHSAADIPLAISMADFATGRRDLDALLQLFERYAHQHTYTRGVIVLVDDADREDADAEATTVAQDQEEEEFGYEAHPAL